MSSKLAAGWRLCREDRCGKSMGVRILVSTGAPTLATSPASSPFDFSRRDLAGLSDGVVIDRRLGVLLRRALCFDGDRDDPADDAPGRSMSGWTLCVSSRSRDAADDDPGRSMSGWTLCVSSRCSESSGAQRGEGQTVLAVPLPRRRKNEAEEGVAGALAMAPETVAAPKTDPPPARDDASRDCDRDRDRDRLRSSWTLEKYLSIGDFGVRGSAIAATSVSAGSGSL
jgi:hypothetical protein